MFNLFKKKSKNFGKRIEPNCDYCQLNSGEEDVICSYYKGEICKKYQYDPFKRKPDRKPVLKEYSQDDFSL